MPDTKVTVARNAQAIGLAVRVPMADLLLALPREVSRDSKVLLSRDQGELRAYFAAHTRVRTRQGGEVPVTIGPIRLHRERDADVGDYAELEVIASARIGGRVPLLLAYDGLLHRIANHRAMVRDFHGRLIGVIRFSLATKTASAIPLPEA